MSLEERSGRKSRAAPCAGQQLGRRRDHEDELIEWRVALARAAGGVLAVGSRSQHFVGVGGEKMLSNAARTVAAIR